MNKTAIYSLLIALLLPVTCYFFMKAYSDRNVVMPRHYIYDSVLSKTLKGKQNSDTAWHKVPDFNLTNQLGKQVSWKDMEGKIVVADFFFTHCPTICPPLALNMKRLQESIKNSERVGDRDPDFIQFLSFSVDPERDSVAALKKWADRFQINPSNWWLLTGDKKEIYDLSLNHMKLGLVDGKNVDSNFMHTDYFVLLDRNRNIRGYYHGLDSVALGKLSEDIIFLTLEKNSKTESIFAGKLELVASVMAIAALAVTALLLFFSKKKKIEQPGKSPAH